jgi:nondiscriminating glutamyl-tRNA synthetase
LVRGPQSFAVLDIGDFVIRRSDGSPALFLSNAPDDALMAVTHVLRDEDHLSNTPRQLLLLEALDHLALMPRERVRERFAALIKKP